MERFKKIALHYDAVNDAKVMLKRAAALAETNRAKLEAVHVYAPVSAAAQFLLGKEKAVQYVSNHKQKVENSLAKHLAELEISSLPLHFAGGDTALETIRLVLKKKCDLLMKMRDTPAQNQAISTTDMKLLRKCPVPVMLLRPGRKRRFSKIVAAIDLGPGDRSRQSLHDNVLKLAMSLSEREGAELDIVHAWQTFSPTTLHGPRFKMSSEEFKKLADEEKLLREKWLEEALAPFRDTPVKVRTHLVQGVPSEVITELVARRRADLLVMGSLARGGLKGLLIGNTAEQVLAMVKCSTLTIKPDDFICPVQVSSEKH